MLFFFCLGKVFFKCCQFYLKVRRPCAVMKRWRLIHVRTHMQRPVHEALAKTPAHARARRDADAGADVSARANRTE